MTGRGLIVTMVMVDDDLVLAAPYYLDTAGLGDVLCGYAAIAE